MNIFSMILHYQEWAIILNMKLIAMISKLIGMISK